MFNLPITYGDVEKLYDLISNYVRYNNEVELKFDFQHSIGFVLLGYLVGRYEELKDDFNFNEDYFYFRVNNVELDMDFVVERICNMKSYLKYRGEDTREQLKDYTNKIFLNPSPQFRKLLNYAQSIL